MATYYRAANDGEDVFHTFISPWIELNAGLWSLFAGATLFLAARIWIKISRNYGLWYDDYILVLSWIILLATDSLIIHEFATGYILENSKQKWDDRMHILINVSSCTNLIGQSLTKTAFAVTLLRLSKKWQKAVLWFCIVTMNSYMLAKVILQWAKICGSKSTDQLYRFDFCLDKSFRDNFKEGGNIYNILMDFVFATFPWLLTSSVDMRRIEKIGLCAVMSLGMIVAIVSAIRVGWKDNGNERDAHYIYRNGLSQVWYSSEVAGTIIVQCIPILRPVLRDVHTSITSKKWSSTVDRRSATTFRSRLSGSKRASGSSVVELDDARKKETENVTLKEIKEEREEEPEVWMVSQSCSPSSSPSISKFEVEEGLSATTPFAPRSPNVWRVPENQQERPASIADSSSELSFMDVLDWDAEVLDFGIRNSLSPVPRDKSPQKSGDKYL